MSEPMQVEVERALELRELAELRRDNIALRASAGDGKQAATALSAGRAPEDAAGREDRMLKVLGSHKRAPSGPRQGRRSRRRARRWVRTRSPMRRERRRRSLRPRPRRGVGGAWPRCARNCAPRLAGARLPPAPGAPPPADISPGVLGLQLDAELVELRREDGRLRAELRDARAAGKAEAAAEEAAEARWMQQALDAVCSPNHMPRPRRARPTRSCTHIHANTTRTCAAMCTQPRTHSQRRLPGRDCNRSVARHD